MPKSRKISISNIACHKKFLSLITTITIVSFYLYFTKTISPQLKHQVTGTKKIQEDKCHFPDLNPWDPSIRRFIAKPVVPIKCPMIQPNLTFVNYNGQLLLNATGFKNINNSRALKCLYRYFSRKNGTNDKKLQYSTNRLLNESNPTQMIDDFVEVKCWNKSKNESFSTKKFDQSNPIYWTVHAHPVKKLKHEIYGMHSNTRLSVLLMFIDSVSYSAMRRRMQKTLKFITNEMGMFMFQKMNKVGLNSYPNLMAVISGLKLKSISNDHSIPDVDTKKLAKSQWANVSFLWDKFKSKNYSTVYNEDVAKWGSFHYLAPGFAKKPVDYYYHTFWHRHGQIWSQTKPRRSHCFRNVPIGDTHLDITRRHMVIFKDNLKFILTFFVDYTHIVPMDVGFVDDIYANFFRDMFHGGYLNNTALIFMSDHGTRYGSIRRTFIGAMEEHNPFYGIYFPNWFYKLYPNIKENLLINTKRYTTSFDVHATILDIINENFNGEQKRSTGREMSQLYPIPRNRACRRAGVPNPFCLCYLEEDLPVNNSYSYAANSIIDHLNHNLDEFKNICSTITLKSINRISKIHHQKSIMQKPGYVKRVMLRIAITTEPNNAMFEGIVMENFTENWQVDGEIDRLDAYEGTSDCIQDRSLEKYCICKDYIRSLTG